MNQSVSYLRIAAVLLILLSSLFTGWTGPLLLPDTAEAAGPPQGALHRGHPYVQAAAEVQKKYTKGLMADRDVLGTAIGADADGLPVLRIYAKRYGIAGIPGRLDSLPVEVKVTGLIVALGNTTARYRPAPIGVSTGHYAITAGTIGARVRDASGNVYALSNNHVYANGNNAGVGDPVLQPGPYDGGVDPADRLGTLFAFEELDFSLSGENYMDAAIALSSAANLGNATLGDGYGVPGTDVQEAAIGMPVKKYGRTTGLTRGQVDEINVFVEVCYEVFFDILCIKSAYFYDQIGISSGTPFSAGGDSGSLIVTDDSTNNPVGLLFAGGTDRTFANRIGPVLNRFNVTIDASAPGNIPPAANFTFTTNGLTASFTDTSTDTAPGSVVGWNWNFGDATSSTVQSPQHAYTSAGTYTVTLTVTDDGGATGIASKQVTVTDANKSVHIGDLDGRGVATRSTWKATVTALVHNQNEAPVSGATVSGKWSAGGSGSCRTGKAGTCSISKDRLTGANVTFTVSGVSLSGYTYVPGSNHNPDADGSNGTTITITRP